MVPQSHHRCWVEVDLNALRLNVAALRARIGPQAKLMAVVKADAYGHGLSPVASVLMQSGVDAFAVANLAEALVLRHVGGTGWPVLLLGSTLPFEVPKVVEQNLTPTLSSLEEARWFNQEAQQQGKKLNVHVEVDTGMGRVGFWHRQAPALIRQIAGLPHLRIEGIYTHFPSADENLAVTRRELRGFLRVVETLRDTGVRIPVKHAANSAAILNVPEAMLDMVRPGLLLYGLCPTGCHAAEFHPTLAFKARAAFVKIVPKGRSISYGQTFIAKQRMRVATVAAGYGDGFLRPLSNRAEVLIQGQRCRVIGRVTMDQVMVDVTRLSEVNSGEEVVFIGRQGEQEITASEVAEWAGTISWEVLCGITKSARVPRIYHGASAA